ncbi:unnamed protein product [Thelazia callipaeda]|uniref:PPIase cyclophilin-type domain-containing protein n=1 Tax=Thelazia callipaeda TaxID=103827 RepID=A0A0N5DBJ1_THECL|nr:unnamed protein product [Thelazia callipaeda]
MSVTLQTTLGDIKIELYCDLCPKTCENFLALCASGYYNNCIFHRNIKDFMVQTGDPTGTGKGGNSIWGSPVEDELHLTLKHDTRGVVSMAGNGPNTSRSQFFITYAKHPTLDLKYTVFGRNQKCAFSNKPMLLQDSKINDKISEDSKKHAVETEACLERLREMQKYFEQYAEEYVEEEAEAEYTADVPSKTDRLRERLQPLLNLGQDSLTSRFSASEIVNILRAERAEDIVCIRVPIHDAADKYVIICTPHNMRHADAIVLTLRKCFKLKTNSSEVQPPRKAKVGHWLCYILEDISLHIMSHEARLKYDLESLWGIGWEESLDDDVDLNIPMPSTS